MALPPPVLRRTAAAHRHSPRHRAHSGSDRLRRGAVGARRLDPGAGDRAPEGAAKKIRLFLSLHRPRSAGGPGFLRPPDRDEGRQDPRTGTDRRDIRLSPSTLYAGTARKSVELGKDAAVRVAIVAPPHTKKK